MARLRIAGVLAALVLLAGCADGSPLKLSGPCAPDYVSLALQF